MPLSMPFGLFKAAAGGTAYLYYRLNCISNQDNAVTQIGEIELLLSGVDQVPTMTSGTTSGCTITANDEGTNPAWQTGDDVTTTAWQTVTAGNTPNWIKWAFSVAKTIDSYSIRAKASAGGQHIYTPTTFNLKASNTGSFSGEEVTLNTQTSIANWSDGLRRSYTI